MSRKKKGGPFDRVLENRARDIIEDCHENGVRVDVDNLAKILKEKYPDFNRQKHHAFTAAVQRVFIRIENSLHGQGSSSPRTSKSAHTQAAVSRQGSGSGQHRQPATAPFSHLNAQVRARNGAPSTSVGTPTPPPPGGLARANGAASTAFTPSSGHTQGWSSSSTTQSRAARKRKRQSSASRGDSTEHSIELSGDDSLSDSAPLAGESEASMVDYQDTNHMNSAMRGLYQQSAPPRQQEQGAAAEASAPPRSRIDLTSSSDSSRHSSQALPAAGSKEERSLSERQRRSVSSARSMPRGGGGGGDDRKRSRNSSRARDRGDGGRPTGSRRKAAAAGNRAEERSTPKRESDKSTVTYADIGGLESAMQQARELIEYPLTHPEVYAHIGVEPPKGVLLHGAPGCGKTLLANAIANECGANFIKVSAPELVAGISGESEKKIRELFDDAQAMAPTLLLIDEIDAVTPKRENAQREMERRIVAQFLTCFDNLSFKETGKAVVVVGTTNRPDALDSALRRTGRFHREIVIGIPDATARARIFEVMTRKMRLDGNIDFNQIAHKTPGYVGADLAAVTMEAANIAIHRIFSKELPNAKRRKVDDPNATADTNADTTLDAPTESNDGVLAMQDDEELKEAAGPAADPTTPTSSDSRTTRSSGGTSLEDRSRVSHSMRQSSKPFTSEELEPLSVTMDDFMLAIGQVQPSSKREGFSTIPDVTWKDVGALEAQRTLLRNRVVYPIAAPKLFARHGISSMSVLLYGPPGCGKTLIAKAVAAESGASFISIKGPELLNQYVGESERAVRRVFHRARVSAPAIIFFDELDALAPKRGGGSSSSSGGNAVSNRVVNQLLTEIDGLDTRNQVFVIAATNRPDVIDPAMLRPGRCDTLVYIPLPDPSEREQILKTHIRKVPVDDSVDVHALAYDSRARGFSGADCAALVREASSTSLQEFIESKFENIASTDDDSSNLSIPERLAKNEWLGKFCGGSGSSTKGAAAACGDDSAVRILPRHFEAAFARVTPSVSERSQGKYDRMKYILSNKRSSSMGDSNDAASSSGSSEGPSSRGPPASSTADTSNSSSSSSSSSDKS